MQEGGEQHRHQGVWPRHQQRYHRNTAPQHHRKAIQLALVVMARLFRLGVAFGAVCYCQIAIPCLKAL